MLERKKKTTLFFTRSICSNVLLLREDCRVNVEEILDNLVVDFVRNMTVSFEAKTFLDDNAVAKAKQTILFVQQTFSSSCFTCERLRKAKRFCNDLKSSFFINVVSAFKTFCRNLKLKKKQNDEKPSLFFARLQQTLYKQKAPE